MNFIKSLFFSLILTCTPFLLAIEPVKQSHRLAVIFDEKSGYFNSLNELENLDGAVITFIEALVSKAMPILVSKATVQNFYRRRQALESPYEFKDAKLQNILLQINKVIRDMHNALTKNSDKAKAQDMIQELLNQMACNAELTEAWKSLAPAYLASFKESDWIIRQVNTEMLLMVPCEHVNARVLAGSKGMHNFTAQELALGLKIDHLPVYSLNELRRAPSINHSALSWRMRDEILNQENSPLFVTSKEYKDLGIKQFEQPWQIYAYGHGYYTDKEELFERIRNALSGASYNDVIKAATVLDAQLVKLSILLDQYQRIGDLALAQKAGSEVENMQSASDAFNRLTSVMNSKVYDHTFNAYAWSRVQQSVQKFRVASTKESAFQAQECVKEFKELVEGIGYLVAASHGQKAQEPVGTNNFYADLCSGRFLGMRMSHVRHFLKFFNNAVPTHTLFVVTCYGAGDKGRALFTDPATQQPIVLNYRYITGAFTDAPSFCDEYHIFDAPVVLNNDNGMRQLQLQPQHNFEQFFTGIAATDEKKLVGAIDAVHPLFPVRTWVNNLPLIRQANSSVWHTLMTDGTVVAANNVNKNKNAEVIILTQPHVQELTFEQSQLPFIVSDCVERQHTINCLTAQTSTFYGVLEAFYGLPSYKADFTVAINKLMVKNNSALASIGCADKIVTLENVTLEHKRFDPALKTNLDTIAFTHKQKRYQACIGIGLELCESNVAQLLDTLVAV